jgi:alkanesulfonate monooxygenase SsuD/methylene tetrahydromethanopterin reductase-like flavin-dependent oxidoreductase (luciferase family)
MPPGYNHPARVAERIATLDLISDGRVEFGTGESSAALELAGYGVEVGRKREMWAEATEQCANMMVMDPDPGFEGHFFSMPTRNVVPKPLQTPHPPIWVACSKCETIHMAARAGIGALTFAFIDPADAVKWVGEYYDIIKSEACVPIGHAVNANIAMVTGFSCHEDEGEAFARGAEGFQFLAMPWVTTMSTATRSRAERTSGSDSRRPRAACPPWAPAPMAAVVSAPRRNYAKIWPCSPMRASIR